MKTKINANTIKKNKWRKPNGNIKIIIWQKNNNKNQRCFEFERKANNANSRRNKVKIRSKILPSIRSQYKKNGVHCRAKENTLSLSLTTYHCTRFSSSKKSEVQGLNTFPNPVSYNPHTPCSLANPKDWPILKLSKSCIIADLWSIVL